jgi:hypothetical protein
MTEPSVEFLWWEGCPSSDDALAELQREMDALGLDPETVEIREISTDADAQREEFVGSPTIRVDGRNLPRLPPARRTRLGASRSRGRARGSRRRDGRRNR